MRPRKYKWFDPPVLLNSNLIPAKREGRPLGSGPNLRFFAKAKVGDSFGGISKAKVKSLRVSASTVGVRFRALKTITGYYIIQIIEKKGRDEQ